jgi:hypothetical protein
MADRHRRFRNSILGRNVGPSGDSISISEKTARDLERSLRQRAMLGLFDGAT